MHTLRSRIDDEIDLFGPPDVEHGKALRGYCPSCDQNVDAELRDCGLGHDEYWGAPMRHVDMRLLCLVCDTDVGPLRAENDDDFELEE
jgi:hypothetical protein